MASAVGTVQKVGADSGRLHCHQVAPRTPKGAGGESQTIDRLTRDGVGWEYETLEMSFWLPHPDTGKDEWVTVRPDFYLPAFDIFLECTRKRCVGGRRRRVQALMRAGKYVILLDDARLREMEQNPFWLGGLLRSVQAQIRLLASTRDPSARSGIEQALAQLLAPFTPPAPRKLFREAA
jgi:hypothetical protein